MRAAPLEVLKELELRSVGDNLGSDLSFRQ